MRHGLLAAWLAMAVVVAGDAGAQGIDLHRATRLPVLEIDAAQGFSERSYTLQTGVYYRLALRADGLDEYRVVAPDLFAASWIEQVVVEDLETHPTGLRALEFDDEGEMVLWFVPVVAGRYRLWAAGLAAEGFEAEVIVK